MEMDGRTYDSEGAKCPECGHVHEGAWDWPDGQHECHGCGRAFDLERETHVTYVTSRMLTCPGCGQVHPCAIRDAAAVAPHSIWRTAEVGWERCPGSRQPGTPQPAKGA